MRATQLQAFGTGVALLLLLCSGGWGARTLLDYQQTPGRASQAFHSWPEAATVVHAKDRLTLLLFAHPQCGCTSATLRELEEALNYPSAAPPDVYVLFTRLGDGPEWRSTPLWKPAEMLPRAHVLWDREGAEARRFGVHTSGQILLYSANGALLFAGGITQARGHVGSNRGRRSLEVALAQSAPVDSFSVFGCSLLGATARGF